VPISQHCLAPRPANPWLALSAYLLYALNCGKTELISTHTHTYTHWNTIQLWKRMKFCHLQWRGWTWRTLCYWEVQCHSTSKFSMHGLLSPLEILGHFPVPDFLKSYYDLPCCESLLFVHEAEGAPPVFFNIFPFMFSLFITLITQCQCSQTD
jgi:hypothetical protein